MKTLFWIVLAAFLLLAGCVVWGVLTQKKARAETSAIPSEVSADSIVAYEQRTAELQTRVEDLRRRMQAAGTSERREVKARLAEFEQQLRELKRAIDQWRVARGGDAPDAAYRQCILLYGQARGACNALAPDTLIGK